jgi:hypothetical protein
VGAKGIVFKSRAYFGFASEEGKHVGILDCGCSIATFICSRVVPPCSCFGKHVIIHSLHYHYYVSCTVGQILQMPNAFVLCNLKTARQI